MRSSGVILLAILCLCPAVAIRAEDSAVQVRLAGDRLEVSAPSLNFVSGKALEHLRNGNSVAFDIQLSVLADARQTVVRRAFERFVFSYDLWEERFSVARMRTSRASVGNLSAHSAESWCIDKLSVLTAGLPQDRPLWVRIDVRAQEVRNKQAVEADEQGFSIAALIELFSRPGRPKSGLQWRAESAAFQIANLGRSSP